jgi:hypothetical protein
MAGGIRTNARANRQRGEFCRAGKGAAAGEQYRLQGDRIGRRKRYERPQIMRGLAAYSHRRESKAI